MEGQGWSGGSRVEGPGYNVKGGGSRLRVKEGGSRVEGVDFGGSIMKGQGPRVKVQGWRVKCGGSRIYCQGRRVKGGGSRAGLCIRSFQKNVPFFAFFSVLFGFISHTNIANLAKKNVQKNVPFFLKNVPFFF